MESQSHAQNRGSRQQDAQQEHSPPLPGLRRVAGRPQGSEDGSHGQTAPGGSSPRISNAATAPTAPRREIRATAGHYDGRRCALDCRGGRLLFLAAHHNGASPYSFARRINTDTFIVNASANPGAAKTKTGFTSV